MARASVTSYRVATHYRDGEVIMFQPGKETNLPTSSGAPMGMKMPDWTGAQLLKVDGFTMTLGLLILIVAVIWLWSMFAKKR